MQIQFLSTRDSTCKKKWKALLSCNIFRLKTLQNSLQWTHRPGHGLFLRPQLAPFFLRLTSHCAVAVQLFRSVSLFAWKKIYLQSMFANRHCLQNNISLKLSMKNKIDMWDDAKFLNLLVVRLPSRCLVMKVHQTPLMVEYFWTHANPGKNYRSGSLWDEKI